MPIERIDWECGCVDVVKYDDEGDAVLATYGRCRAALHHTGTCPRETDELRNWYERQALPMIEVAPDTFALPPSLPTDVLPPPAAYRAGYDRIDWGTTTRDPQGER
jgi:hypothetical protein